MTRSVRTATPFFTHAGLGPPSERDQNGQLTLTKYDDDGGSDDDDNNNSKHNARTTTTTQRKNTIVVVGRLIRAVPRLGAASNGRARAILGT